MAERTLYKAASCTSLLLLLVCLNTVLNTVSNLGDGQPFSKVSNDSNVRGQQGIAEHSVRRGRSLLVDEKECREIHEIEGTEQRCQFVEDNGDCQQDGGFFEYNYFIYCKLGHAVPGAMTVLILWWLFAFVGLAVCADDFFCPSLVVISETLHLSPNVAGVTFLAFGNGAPDFFSAITALGEGGGSELGVGGLFGAGMFVTTVVVGTISVVKPFKAMERPFLRDAIFYMFAVYCVFFVLWREKIYFSESIGLVCIYVVYVITVVISGIIYSKQKEAADAQLVGTVVLKNSPLIDTQSQSAYTVSLSGTANQAFDPDTAVIGTAEGETNIKRQLTRENSMGSLGVIETLPNADELVGDLDKEAEAEGGPSPLPPWWKQLLVGLNPINVDEWSDTAWYGKIYEIFKSPILLAMKLTCPIVDYDEEENHNWNKYLQCVQMLCAPIICSMLMKANLIQIAGEPPAGSTQTVYGFQLWMLMLIIGASFSILVFFTSKPETKPVYHWAFGYFAFLIALIWIRVIANEIVAILETFGVVFNISNAILGLTLLAWGNSIGDWIANTVMARQGFARMGFAACFGAPLFNLCLGFGIPNIIQSIQKNEDFTPLTMTAVTMILSMFLLTSLCLSLVLLPILKFKVNRYYGITLLIIYIVFLIVALLTESKLIFKNFSVPRVPKVGI